MSHVDASPLSMYNSLSDPHLAGYFANTKMKTHLRRTGLVTRRGEIVSDNTYRLNMARKEHKKHVKDLLAQAIVEKTLDLERSRQVAIRQKLEEIAKIHLVQRIKHTRQRRNDEDILPYLSPRGSRPQSGPSPRSHRSNRSSKGRPVSAPSFSQDPKSSSYDSNDEEDVTYVDEHGNPIEWSEGETSGNHGRGHTPRTHADVEALYALNPGELRRYAAELARMEQTNALVSPYLVPQIPLPPSSPRTPRGARQRRFRSHSADKSPKRGQGPDLHPRHPPMMHQGDVHSMCKVRMKYHGWALNLARERLDPRQEVHIEQQHCGGNTLTVFRELLMPGSEFTFTSKRHRGYPFSLTMYIDGRQDARVSVCCEMGHSKNCRLGGKQGHFSIIGYEDASPCYKCQVKKGLKGRKAPRRQLKHPPQGGITEEVLVMDVVSKETKKKEETRDDDEEEEQAVTKILVPVEPEVDFDEKQETSAPDYYEDDFDDDEDDKEEEPDEVLYSKSWDEDKNKQQQKQQEKVQERKKIPVDDEEDEDKRQIRGLADDFEVHMKDDNTKSVPAEKSTPPNAAEDYEEVRGRKVEGYSSEEEDLEGEKTKIVEVEKKTEQMDSSVRKGRNRRKNGPKGRMGTRPKHPRILSLDAAKGEAVEAEVHREDAVNSQRVPSPPQKSQKPSRVIVDRDNDYSSESSESPSSSSSDEEEQSSERLAPQGRESRQSKDDKTEPELEAIAQSNRSTESSETSSSSASSERENKLTSLPERPRSPVAATLMKEEQRKESPDPDVQTKEDGQKVEQKRPSPDESKEEVIKELEKAPVQADRPVLESRGQEGETPRSTTSDSSDSSSTSETDRSIKQAEDISTKNDEANAKDTKSTSESETSSESSPESSPRPVKETDQLGKDEKNTVSSTSSSSSSSDESTPRAQDIKADDLAEKDVKPETESSSSSDESTPRSEAGGVAAKPASGTGISLVEGTQQVKTDNANPEESHLSSQQEDGQQTAIPLSAPGPTAEIKEVEQAQESTIAAEASAVGADMDEKKTEDATKGLASSVKGIEEAPTTTEDSSSDSNSSSSSSGSSSSSSDDESETEGELIVNQDTPRGQGTQRSEVTDTDAGPDNGDTTARTGEETSVRSDTTNEPITTGDTARGTEQPPEPEQRSLPSPPTSPPSSPQNGEQERIIPPVVVIPNTPEVTDTPRGQDVIERAASPLPKRSGKVPEHFEYKAKHDSTDDEQQRRQSESEPENMHGGNDPDNVAENDSGNWKGSMEFSAPPEQTSHQGSITPLLDNSDDIQMNNISLTKPQLVEVLQQLELKETVHTLSISNANLGMEEMGMLLQSLSKTSAKPTVLNLNYNILGPSSVETLVEVLKIKPSVEMLLLHGNPVGNKGLQTLVDGMLDIEYEAQKFKERESERLGGAPIVLPKGRFCQIKELDIGEASVTDEGMVEVALLLESNLDLKTLSLSSSPDISQSGWRKLAASIAKNRKLETLTLEHNKIGDAGMELLADGLQNNTSITSLDLAYARIGENGGRAIIELLKKNTTIRNLTLSPGNNIPEKILDEINRYLHLNMSSP